MKTVQHIEKSGFGNLYYFVGKLKILTVSESVLYGPVCGTLFDHLLMSILNVHCCIFKIVIFVKILCVIDADPFDYNGEFLGKWQS